LIRIDLNKTKRINQIKLASLIQQQNRELKKPITIDISKLGMGKN